MPPAALSKPELFSRLAAGTSAGKAAGITVVTPNRRLAQVLRAEFDAYQAERKLTVWEDADILPVSSWIERRYEDALYDGSGSELPVLLSGAQERELWEEAIRASSWAGALLDVPRTAARAMDAWRTANAWRIAGGLEKFDGTEDTRAFADWARAYARRLKKDGLIDGALLADLDLKGRIEKPRLLVAYAFDILPPQTEAALGPGHLACHPEKKDSKALKASFASPKEELESAARWARARLEAGSRRIGVVVPELDQRRREVARVFARVMGSPLPFNLSLGEPLGGYPLVSFALALLEFSAAELPFEEASRIIRSPFLGGAAQDMAARARLDARLRREAPAALSLPKLIGLMGQEAGVRPLLEAVFEKSQGNEGKSRSPYDWAQHFTAVLAAAGFPGDRALDSAEYQTRARFNEVLGEFAKLGLVAPAFSLRKALQQLRRLCNEALFQPESPEAPVQVLGLLESAGMEFDALWVSGLTDDAWPLRARPNPFLPLALQRKAGIPEASADGSLALDRRITEGWAGAAAEVVFSWPRRTEDRDLSPSPLIAPLPEGRIEVPSLPVYRDLVFSSRALESFEDEKADPLVSKTVRGGTRVLADQAACPFRAYARHRLRAEALASPEPGPDAMDRGQLLHALMAGIWRELKTQEGLQKDVSPVVARAAEQAVRELGLEDPFAALEVRRLAKLAKDWLDVERERAPFEVVHIEQKKTLEVGGLSLNGRIDRMDKLADGTHAIIDYKTGSRVTPNDWLGAPPDDPQLPLYAVSAAEKVSVLAFAKLRAGDMKFTGFSRHDKAIPGVKQAKSWEGLVENWKSELASLAGGFAGGDARVAPKRGLATCRHCDLQPLCRVHERLGALQEDGEGE